MKNWNDSCDRFVIHQSVRSNLIYGVIPKDPVEVSIMIPTYHRATLLRLAVESALRQEGGIRFIVIVVDNAAEIDAETDALMQEICGVNGNVLYYRNEKNLGQGGNWNRCVELSASEIFCILHDDDQLLPDYLCRLLPIAKKTRFGAIGVFNRYEYYVGEFGEVRNQTDKMKRIIAKFRGDRLIPFQLQDAIKNMRPSPTACLFYKKACMEVGGFAILEPLEDGLVCDDLFFCQMCRKWPVFIYPQVLALRGVGENDSQSPDMATNIIIGNYRLNQQIISEIPRKYRSYYSRINDIMVISIIQSFQETYGVALNEKAIVKQLHIERKHNRAFTTKALRALTWGIACLRPEDYKVR